MIFEDLPQPQDQSVHDGISQENWKAAAEPRQSGGKLQICRLGLFWAYLRPPGHPPRRRAE